MARFIPFYNFYFFSGVVSLIGVGIYVAYLGAHPALMRSFVMLIVAFILFWRHVELFSFEILFWVVLILLALYPRFFFMVGFWLSVGGVFFIYLFIHHFKITGIKSLIAINFWLFWTMLPLSHLFFYQISPWQLLATILSLAFIIFYPLALFIHLLGFGWVFDGMLNFSLEPCCFIKTPVWFLALYLAIAFGSIYKHRFIYLLLFFPLLIYEFA